MIVRNAVLIAVGAALFATPVCWAGNIDLARNLVNKGNYLMASQKFAEALKTYEEAQKYEPSNAVIKENIAKVYNNWAIWFTRQKKYHEAQEKLQKCLELMPGYSQARTNMGLLKRMAMDDGIDLDAPEGSDPAIPKLPDGGEVKKPLADGSQAPKTAPVQPEQQAGAVLFIGGVKQPAPPMVDSYPISATSAPPETPPTSAPGTGTTVPPSLAVPAAPVTTTPPPANPDPGPATFTMKPQNPMFPVTPNQYPNDALHSPAPPAAPTTTPATPPPAVPAVSFDEQLSAVEMKVYGAKQTNLTVLQRIEKIEKDSLGQPRNGTILERINYLKSSFGL